MFEKIFIFFAAWFDKSVRFFQQASAFLAWEIAGVVSLLLGIGAVWTYLINSVNRLLIYLCGYLDGIQMSSDVVSGVQSSTVSFMSMLELANTFFPVSEMFSLMVSIAMLYSVVSVYGLIKSWIPTLSG